MRHGCTWVSPDQTTRVTSCGQGQAEQGRRQGEKTLQKTWGHPNTLMMIIRMIWYIHCSRVIIPGKEHRMALWGISFLQNISFCIVFRGDQQHKLYFLRTLSLDCSGYQNYAFILSHCGLVMPNRDSFGSTLAQLMACCLTVPSRYLRQC